MQTIKTGRVITTSITIQAPPGEVHAFLAEPDNLTRWAPGFAQAVRADGDELVVTSNGGDVRMAMSTSPTYGTVDMVTAADRRLGVFVRILPNGEGSECVFSLAFPDDTPDEAVTGQMAVVAAELSTIKSLTEAQDT
jgi:Polyketide cyclase / dehydrase and lipid transport